MLHTFLKQFSLLSVILYGWCTAAGTSKYLTDPPDYIKSCKIMEKDFIKCSTNSIQQLFNKLNTGIPGLDSIKSFDPFYLDRIKISQGNSQAINLKVELSNIKITGFGYTHVLESIVYPKDYSWKTTFTLPTMKLQGDYNLFGRILLIPLNGKGEVFLEAANMTVVMHTRTRLYEKGDFTFYNVTNIGVDFKLEGLKSYFSNLFNGQKQLEDSTNKFFNDNWRMLTDALYTVITQTIEDILLDVLKKIFHFIPANYFVGDIPTSAQLYDGIIAWIISSESPLTIDEGLNIYAMSNKMTQSPQIDVNRSKELQPNLTSTEDYVPSVLLEKPRSNLAKHVALIKMTFEDRSICAYMAAIIAKNAVVSLNFPDIVSIKLYVREYLCKKECEVDIGILVGTSSCYNTSSVHLQILRIKKIWLAEMTTTTLLMLDRSITLSSAAAIIPLPKRLPRGHESCVVLSTGKQFTYEIFQLDVKIVMFSKCDGSEFTKFGYTTVLCVKFLDIAGIDHQPNFCGLLSDSSPLICNGVLSGFYSGDESCTAEYAWFFNVYNTSSVIRTILPLTEEKLSAQCKLKPCQWFGLLLLYVDWMSYYNYLF